MINPICRFCFKLIKLQDYDHIYLSDEYYQNNSRNFSHPECYLKSPKKKQAKIFFNENL